MILKIENCDQVKSINFLCYTKLKDESSAIAIIIICFLHTYCNLQSYIMLPKGIGIINV